MKKVRTGGENSQGTLVRLGKCQRSQQLYLNHPILPDHSSSVHVQHTTAVIPHCTAVPPAPHPPPPPYVYPPPQILLCRLNWGGGGRIVFSAKNKHEFFFFLFYLYFIHTLREICAAFPYVPCAFVLEVSDDFSHKNATQINTTTNIM